MDITPILEGVVTIAVALITGLLIPYLKEKYGAEKIRNSYDIIKILVNAVEQTTKIAGAGKEKKAVVLERLEDYDIKVDADKVNEMIESAVAQMNIEMGKKVDIK